MAAVLYYLLSEQQRQSFLTLPAAAVLGTLIQVGGETFLVWLFGSTPGKASVGLKVVSRDDEKTLSLKHSFLRALKVGVWGYGVWFPVLCILTTALTAFRLATGRSPAWERGEQPTAVVAVSSGWRRIASSWAIAASAPLLVALSWVVVTDERAAHRSTLATQALSRSISGTWTWLNPISGKVHTIDSTWRLEREGFNRTQGYSAVFADGDSADVSATFRVVWKLHGLLASCVVAETLAEDFTFFVVSTLESSTAERLDCELHGGSIRAGKTLRKSVKASYFKQQDAFYALIFEYPAGNEEAYERLETLATLLHPEFRSGAVVNGQLGEHHWRNDVTGKVAPIPSPWTLHRLGTSGDTATFAFVRELDGKDEHDGRAALHCRPMHSGDDWREGAAQVVATAPWFKHLSWELKASDHSYFLRDAKQVRGRVFFVEGKRCGWTLAWTVPPEGEAASSVEKHELLKKLATTLR